MTLWALHNVLRVLGVLGLAYLCGVVLASLLLRGGRG